MCHLISPNQQFPSSSSMPKLPPCKAQPKGKPSQPKSKTQVKSKGKSKSRRKNATPTKAPPKPLPTLPPFDFETYLREKDKRDFNLLIDQPEKCHIKGAKEEEGGRGASDEGATAPYMLIAVKSVAADFDKRQVKISDGVFNNSLWGVTFSISGLISMDSLIFLDF